MCFYKSKKKEYKNKKVAKKDFIVYKIYKPMISGITSRRSIVSSPFQGTSHNKKDLLKVSVFGYRPGNYSTIYEGIHSYKKRSLAQEKVKLSLFLPAYCRTYTCVIPKGTKYYENDDEIVSLKLFIGTLNQYKKSVAKRKPKVASR